jgi:hypothetical protein
MDEVFTCCPRNSMVAVTLCGFHAPLLLSFLAGTTVTLHTSRNNQRNGYIPVQHDDAVSPPVRWVVPLCDESSDSHYPGVTSRYIHTDPLSPRATRVLGSDSARRLRHGINYTSNEQSARSTNRAKYAASSHSSLRVKVPPLMVTTPRQGGFWQLLVPGRSGPPLPSRARFHRRTAFAQLLTEPV